MKDNRWQKLGTSIFSVMTEEAVRHDAVNLAQGFPNFDGPEVIKKAASQAIYSGFNQYAPSIGLAELRQKLARRQLARTGLSYDPALEVTIFSGATEALFCAIMGLLEPLDEIIAFAPFYDSYPAAAMATGARFKVIDLKPPHWEILEDDLRRSLGPNTRAIILNSPHNPTGHVLSSRELEGIARVAIQHDLLVITDEVYEDLVFAPHEHRSIATIPGMRERTMVISSTSKTFSMTGWKVGYAFAPKELTNPARAVHQFTVFCSATPLQAGMCAAIDLTEDYYEAFRRDYTERRDYLMAALIECGFQCHVPQGTYFIMADYSALSDKSDLEFCRWLTREAKVAAIPMSAFYVGQSEAYKGRLVRFAFCKDMATLAKARERLRAFFPVS